MKRSTIIPMALVIAAGAIMLAWQFGDGAPSAPPDRTEARQSRSDAASQDRAAAPIQVDDGSRVPRGDTQDTEAAAEEERDVTVTPSPPEREGQPYRLPMDDAYFASEYAGWDRAALAKEASKVLSEYIEAQNAAFRELRRAGRYTPMEKDDDGKVIFDGFSDGTLYSTQKIKEHPEGMVIMTLPFGEYASVYDLGDRWNWLNHAKDR